MTNTRINPMYHPLFRHFPVDDPDKEKLGKSRNKLMFCSTECSYYCQKHDFVAKSKIDMRDHLRNSEDHSI